MNHLTTEALNLYLDDALDARERAAADAHLAMCEVCQAELSALRQLFATIEALPLDPLPADLTARVLEQIAIAPEPRTENRRTTQRVPDQEPELQTTDYGLRATNYGQNPQLALVVAALAIQVALGVALAIWLAPQLVDAATAGLGVLRLPAPSGLASVLIALNSWVTAAGAALSGLARAGDALSIGLFGGFTTAQWSIILVGVGLVWFFGNRFLLAGSLERCNNHQEAA
jgi:anti-sigma factor RsiW